VLKDSQFSLISQEPFVWELYQPLFSTEEYHSAECCLYLYCNLVLFGVVTRRNMQRENAVNRSTLTTLPPLL